MEESWDRAPAGRQFLGSAVVTGASYSPHSTLLRLQTFAGEHIEYLFGDIPDPAGAAELHANGLRPISVKIQNSGERCSVVALALNGSRRSTVTLGTALALYQAGVHAVVDGGLRRPLPRPPQRLPARRPIIRTLGADLRDKKK